MKEKIDPIKFMKDYCDFSNPENVWIMTGMIRNKDNQINQIKFLKRFIIKEESDLQYCRNEIHRVAININTYYRLYISLNARNVVNSFFNFQKRLLDLNIGLAKGYEDALNLSKKVSSLWKTELEQIRNRGTKRILLDIDDCQDSNIIYGIVDYIEDNCHTTLHCVHQTVTGYSIVFDACDVRGLLKMCKEENIKADIQRDSLVFVEKWKGNLIY